MSNALRSPVWWFGGKGVLAPRILPLLPPHTTYVEPFGGGASVLLAKAPSPVEVYNDLHSGLTTLFRVLREPDLFSDLARRLAFTPYSREVWRECRDTWEGSEDPVEKAYRFYVNARQSFGGNLGSSWGFNVGGNSGDRHSTAAGAWLSAIEQLPALAERLREIQVEHDDFRAVLDRYDRPETLFYLDPPYVPSTRRSGSYTHELSLTDHEELVGLLLALKGKAALSGYPHAVYAPLEAAGWERRDFRAHVHVTGGTRGTRSSSGEKEDRMECVWRNPAALQARAQTALDFAPAPPRAPHTSVEEPADV